MLASSTAAQQRSSSSCDSAEPSVVAWCTFGRSSDSNTRTQAGVSDTVHFSAFCISLANHRAYAQINCYRAALLYVWVVASLFVDGFPLETHAAQSTGHRPAPLQPRLKRHGSHAQQQHQKVRECHRSGRLMSVSTSAVLRGSGQPCSGAHTPQCAVGVCDGVADGAPGGLCESTTSDLWVDFSGVGADGTDGSEAPSSCDPAPPANSVTLLLTLVFGRSLLTRRGVALVSGRLTRVFLPRASPFGLKRNGRRILSPGQAGSSAGAGAGRAQGCGSVGGVVRGGWLVGGTIGAVLGVRRPAAPEEGVRRLPRP